MDEARPGTQTLTLEMALVSIHVATEMCKCSQVRLLHASLQLAPRTSSRLVADSFTNQLDHVCFVDARSVGLIFYCRQ